MQRLAVLQVWPLPGLVSAASYQHMSGKICVQAVMLGCAFVLTLRPWASDSWQHLPIPLLHSLHCL